MEAKATRIRFEDADGSEIRAQFPHCDDKVLHAPGECQYCDHYPEAQEQRIRDLVNFTGHYAVGFALCPSEERRSLQTIEAWPGNQPTGLSAAHAALHPELREARARLIESIALDPREREQGREFNMPAAIRESTLATRTDARDRLGAAVSAIANEDYPVDRAAIEIGIAMILEAIGKPRRCPQCSDLS